MAQTKIRKEQLVTGMFLIEDINATGGTQTEFDFQSIPSTYKSLQIHVCLRSNVSATLDVLQMRFNNDSGSNYDALISEINHTDTITTTQSLADASPWTAWVTGNTGIASDFSQGVITLSNYASANVNKDAIYIGGYRSNSTSGFIRPVHTYFHWRSTAAISRITLLNPKDGTAWMQYSRATLYGIL